MSEPRITAQTSVCELITFGPRVAELGRQGFLDFVSTCAESGVTQGLVMPSEQRREHMATAADPG